MRSVKTPAPLGPTVSQPASTVRPKTGDTKDKDDTAVWSLKHIQVLWSWAARPAPVPYPSIASIPCTSVERLSAPDVSPTPFPSEPILAKSFAQDAPAAAAKPETVLYLAYGSNMCAETFLGMRGIRPLSQVNVSAPSLDLTFDLPGIPYREPCFANTALRKIPGANPPKFPPGLPDRPPIEPPFTSAPADEEEDDESTPTRRAGPTWTKGLYGIVYEVTASDYAKILATEGGGASYHDILVPCLVLPPSIRVPEQPTLPPPPRPFLAHTLFAPRLPDLPEDKPSPPLSSSSPNQSDDGDDDVTPPPKKLPAWLAPLLRPVRRPSATYAQPSARYLKLLRDGAREHDLPADYQSHLARLSPYTATTRRQKIGQVLFLGFWAPLVILMMVTGRAFADEKGRAPAWVVAGSTVLFNLVWMSYDAVGRGVFGDGERTVEGSKTMGRERKGSFASGLRGVGEVGDEEKRGLMDSYR